MVEWRWRTRDGQAVCGIEPWRPTTPSFPTATPRTSRSRRRCNRWCRSSASPGTGAARCASFATIPACRPRRACGPRSNRRSSQSRFLILLASPGSAASQWVGKEVSYWLEHKGPDTLLIAVTERRPGLGQRGRRLRTARRDTAAGGAGGPVRERAEMGGSAGVPRRRQSARHALRRARAPISPPPSTACRRRTCSPRNCASNAAR